MRVGFVGVGKIGHAMCRRFVEGGYEVVAYDLEEAALARIVALGAARARSAADVAARCDIHLLGGPGAGSVGKIANNIMSMCNMLAANEAFLMGKRWGIA